MRFGFFSFSLFIRSSFVSSRPFQRSCSNWNPLSLQSCSSFVRQFSSLGMDLQADEEVLVKELEGLNGAIEAQVLEINQKKEEGTSKDEIGPLVSRLQELRKNADVIRKKIEMPRRLEIDKNTFDGLMKRRFFFTPSFSLYGGVSGLYDLGPPGCAMKANMINLWRKHFVVAEGMYEVDTTSVTPEHVLRASGHVTKFSDLMVRDLENEKCYRADHLITDKIEELLEDKSLPAERRKELVLLAGSVEEFDAEKLTEVIKEMNIKAPETANDLSDVYPFNLMFATDIGPTGKAHGFLRPETAQGLFMNFNRLLEANGGRIPFAGACVGQAFRNEISPRAGLLRVLEFTICEIEHFFDPQDRSHSKYEDVAKESVLLYSRERQADAPQRGQIMTIQEALEKNIISGENIGYFMGRITKFARKVGLKEGMFRFRQHKQKEMAHYAQDCWDLEALTSYGWVECIGFADRSCFDLTVHAKATNAKLHVFRPYDKVKMVEKSIADPAKGLIGKAFKADGKKVMAYLAKLDDDQVAALKDEFEKNQKAEIVVDGKNFSLEAKMVTFKKKTEKQTGEYIVPSVIEPSFGIGRLLYSVWEQSFYIRGGDEQRNVLSLSPAVAPTTCLVLPLMVKQELLPPTRDVVKRLAEAGISHSEDSSGAAVGRRYARADEIGVPYAVTIDYVTLDDSSVTFRERDSMKQVRVQMGVLCNLIRDLVEMRTSWDQVYETYPHVEVKEN